MFDFHMRVVDCDREGYYFPRWDRATPITARAKTKQEAINTAAAALGEPPHGRYWGFKVDRIEAAS